MRIISGEFKGIKLETIEGKNTRPTLDRVKESMFNTIESLMYIENTENVLDLYAGSGGLGIECLSRTETNITLVEKNPKAIEKIRGNIAKLGDASKRIELFGVDSELALKKFAEEIAKGYRKPFDIIFLDPPYTKDGSKDVEYIIKNGILEQKSLIVYETDRQEYIDSLKKMEENEILEIVKERKYGRPSILYITGR